MDQVESLQTIATAMKAELFPGVRKALEEGAKLYCSDQAAKHSWTDAVGEPAVIPAEPGVYAIFLSRTGDPVYTGESRNLRRRLRQHTRVSGRSVFKRRWVRHWIGGSAGEDEVVEFIHENMFFRILPLAFGRKEIEEELQRAWGIMKPEDVRVET